MNMKALAASAAVLLCTHAVAGTYTWTGSAGNGLWYDAGNWQLDGVAAETSPGSSPAHDVVINGNNVVVTYVPQADFSPQTGVTITVSNGAKLVQGTGGNWVSFGTGAELVLDGGSYDGGPSWNFQLNDGKLTIRNGGEFNYPSGALSRSSNSSIVLESGTMVLGGNVTLFPTDTLGRGSLATTGEATITGDVTFDGFSLSCSTFTPQNNPTISLKEGSLTTARTADATAAGIWGSCSINFLVGKAASFSAFQSSAPYADTFGTSQFLYNGAPLSESEFNDLFTVETAADGDRTRWTISTSPVAGAPYIESETASYASGSASFAVTLAETAPDDTAVTVFYDMSDHEHNTDFGWPNRIELAKGENGVFSGSAALATEGVYHYLIRSTSESAGQTVWLHNTIIAAEMPTDSFVWIGTTSDASLASNWSRNAVPGADDIVEFNAYYSRGGLVEWDSETIPEVAGWRQSKDVYVLFDTTNSHPFIISGNASLTAGAWSHVGPADTPSGMVNVSVGGDLTIGSGARIVAGTGMNTNDDDGRPRGYTAGHGPSYLRTAGGSYAGEGGHITNTTGFVSYGSILDPLSYGSGGWGDNTLYAGGGVVKLVVAGTLTVDGVIRSRGFGYPLDAADTLGGAGSGGSINITAASLSGAGTIDANGGSYGLYGPGSGGRIKVALTGAGADFTGFAGRIEAVGGSMQGENQCAIYDVSPAAAGTVCLQVPGADPVVKVFNEFRHAGIGQEGAAATWRVAAGEAIPSATHIPSMEDGDVLSNVRWELSGHGALRVTKDVRTYSLSLASDDGSQCVYTDGKVLTVKELAIAGTTKRAGRYTAAELPDIVVGNGAIVVDFMPTVIVVR